MLKEMFKKNDLTSAGRKQVHLGGKVKESLDEAQIPDGLFEKCDKCNEIVYSEDVVANYYICPNCGMYFRISPRTRLSMILDKESFQEWDKELPVSDPLNFPGYKQKLEHLKVVTNLDEAVITGEGKINDTSVAIGIMASNFLMGSMGEVVGEKLTRLVEKATKRKLPVIIFCCSGGARMQEGIISLMQMAKTAQALKRHDEAGLLYVSVLTDPTTGGVMASFAMLGDVILAEPGALIGFAGPRVIEQTIGQRLPEGFQKAEFLLEHGFVDKIVKRNKLKQTLSMLVKSC
ncbi:acetyl-CoA carboxylase, carboxyltransferase subunit beta [Anaerocolumna cellulosilytica]|nr:acetyl-CoA carboxylase carboxyl transferase subunit beta [Anaerocolumna cellulosilytica]